MHNTTSYQNMYPGPQNAFDIYYSDSSISALYELKSPYLLIKEVFDYDSDLFKTYAEAPHFFYQNEQVLSETIKNFSRRHQHNFFEIMFVMRGSTEQKIEDQNTSIMKDSAVYWIIRSVIVNYLSKILLYTF